MCKKYFFMCEKIFFSMFTKVIPYYIMNGYDKLQMYKRKFENRFFRQFAELFTKSSHERRQTTMQILHNMSAVMAAEQHGINTSNYQKSTKKLGSGYQINTAADGPAQLSISEKMRAQIRGLNKAVNNGEEGASYIQVADGAMNEIHSMLQRMRELSVQALNDTNTQEDRMAMAMEMDKIQAEIDRIDTSTYYNNMPVFQEHEPSYYQIAGNRVWASNQQHAVMAPDNSLNIHLPAGEYVPDTYTITVPDGIYTTQELIDEIDDAFARMSPANPGFVLEYMQDGRCSLNFEGANGQPTKIDSVDGSLAYLIYDCYNGLSTMNLLGTTAFDSSWPLKITKDQNDEIQFQIEPTDGSPSTTVSMKIKPGEYTRAELIKLLNQELVKYPGVEAKEYGQSCIQITGGYDNNITGLKGNMFKLELGTEHVYTSVFYDNIRYGTTIGTPAAITGKTYYHDEFTNKIKIDGTNDTLSFKYNGNQITVKIPAGEYIIDDISNTSKDNLTYVLNEEFKKIAGADISVTAPETASVYTNGKYVRYRYLVMTSETTGKDLEFEFDTSGVYGETFKTLFEDTNYDFIKEAYYRSGDMRIYGSAVLRGQIKIPNGANTLSLSVNKGPAFTITIPPRTYNSLADLVTELNQQLPTSQKGMIEFVASGDNLVIQGVSNNITDLNFGNTSGAYTQLFTTREVNKMHLTATGEEHYLQGSTAPDINQMASVTMKEEIPLSSTTIDGYNDSLYFTLNGQGVWINLDHGTYSRAGLIDELNKQFAKGGHNVEASLIGNHLTLTTTLSGMSQKLSLDVDTWHGGNGWDVFVGLDPTPVGPSMPEYAHLRGENEFTNITLDNTNNNFEFELEDGTKCNVTLPAKAYTLQQLVTELQVVIDSQIGAGKIEISTFGNTLRMNAISLDGNFKDPKIQNSSFYKNVFCKNTSGTHTGQPVHQVGEHSYDEAFIIGRYDVTSDPIEIASGVNDKFIIDLTYKSHPSDPKKDYSKPLEVTIPPGTYTGNQLAALLTPLLNAQLAANNITGFELKAEVGGHNTGVAGAIDANALQITLLEATKPGSSQKIESAPGTYVLEGVRGSAASSIFYKTNGKPEPSYVTGAQSLTGGVIFPPDKRTLTLKTDGVSHSYTFTKEFYNANEVVDFLNDKFEHGDDNGKTAPLVASLENGRLKITHKVVGSHTITEIGGSAKGVVFYYENGRKGQDGFMLQVGALGNQGLELPRLRVGTASLKINSITISKPKYAEKALRRLDEAINMLSERRSTYGALQNRIEYLNANNRNIAQNVQASESRIRDADMAKEMVEHLKNKLLTQVSESVLAQANQVPNRLLNLLQ